MWKCSIPISVLKTFRDPYACFVVIIHIFKNLEAEISLKFIRSESRMEYYRQSMDTGSSLQFDKIETKAKEQCFNCCFSSQTHSDAFILFLTPFYKSIFNKYKQITILYKIGLKIWFISWINTYFYPKKYKEGFIDNDVTVHSFIL